MPEMTPTMTAAALRATDALRAVRPDIATAVGVRPDLVTPVRPTLPQPQPQPQPRLAPQPEPPRAPVAGAPNPFDQLPYPAPGDRIRADDFRRLSECLGLIRDAYLLAGALIGRTLAEARTVLAAQGYAVGGVVGVFGNVLADPNDAALDNRRVLHAAPAALGERRVVVIVSEPVETRRLTPNLLGRTYADATSLMRATIGDAVLPGGSVAAPRLVGLTLDQAGAARR
jgi:hypothetical protein